MNHICSFVDYIQMYVFILSLCVFVLCIFFGYVYHTDLKSCKTAPSSAAMDSRRVAKPASANISVAQ